jgi:predicted metal-binding membrane protein
MSGTCTRERIAIWIGDCLDAGSLDKIVGDQRYQLIEVFKTLQGLIFACTLAIAGLYTVTRHRAVLESCCTATCCVRDML